MLLANMVVFLANTVVFWSNTVVFWAITGVYWTQHDEILGKYGILCILCIFGSLIFNSVHSGLLWFTLGNRGWP